MAFELDEREPEAMNAFPCAEIPEFIAAVRAEDGTVWRALECVFLTGQRSKQVRHMVWGELHDLDKSDKARWIVPPERRKKGKRDLILPLSLAVVALLGKRGADVLRAPTALDNCSTLLVIFFFDSGGRCST